MVSHHYSQGLSVLNPSPTRLPGPALLHDLIQTARNDEAPAIDYLPQNGPARALSYAQLHASSDVLATRIWHELGSLPPRKDSHQLIIPLMIPQSPELYIAQLAILKAGGAFCPLNLDAPSDRVRFIFGDVGANLILTTSSSAGKIPQDDGSPKILLVGEGLENSGETGPLLVPRVSEDDLAYIMYTSGSTGTPKGVGISHLAATQSLLAHDRHIPRFSRFLQFAAPTFDVSVFEIFFPLFRGSTLVCCNRADMLTDLPGVLNRMNVDACELTPSVAGSLLKRRSNAPRLRLLLTIGEMLTQPVVSEFGGSPEQESMLWGMYGPTEAAIHCTLQPAFSQDASTSCIGYPLDTVSSFVIALSEDSTDPPFEILPIGQVGELVVGGHQLATGYINRPEQTASVFLQTEFGRVYRTGDKARLRSDGTIECLGRVSEGQVKLNGQRMELGEIEHVMLRTEGCHGAFVCVISNSLIAFAAVDDAADKREAIANTCKAWLPSFMVPAEVVVMADFPRLPSGKIDRRRMKHEYTESHSNDAEERVEYKDDLERLLCSIASQVLRENVLPSSNLASAGLDSLASIQFSSRLRGEGWPVTTFEILDAKTVSALHGLLRQRSAEKEVAEDHPGSGQLTESSKSKEQLRRDSGYSEQAEDIEYVTGCTALQTSMVVETLKDSRLYVNRIKIQCPKHATVAMMRTWFVKVAEQNEILRSGFIHLDGGLVQAVWKDLLDEQVRAVRAGEPLEQLDPEDFLRRPLRVDFKENDQHHPEAMLTIHHAIYDGWTFDLLLEDLSQLASGEELSKRPQFRHVSQQAENIPSKEDHETAKEFWADHLRGHPGSSLPNFKTMAISSPEILTTSNELNISPDSIRKLSLASGVGSQDVFQACFAWLWGGITGAQDVTIGSVFSGRTAPVPGIERAMGPCIQTLPLRLKIGESRLISELIQSLHRTSRQIIRRGTLPLGDIKRAAGLPLGTQLFDVLFVYQESLASRGRSAVSETFKELWHQDALETKLLLEVEPRGDIFVCTWTWHSDAFNSSQVQSFSNQFNHLVDYFVRHLDDPISSVRGAFPSSHLSSYTTGMRPVQTLSSIASLVQRTADLFPEKAALCFANSITGTSIASSELNYAELNKAANKMARYILDQGASPGCIVAIIMEKSPLLYCGILGILKAGCAYMPLLPSTPAKRLELIFEQAKPSLCVVDNVQKWSTTSPVFCPVVDPHDPAIGQYLDTSLELLENPEQLAYVIYTSGTTGTPKGVAVTNKNMLSNVEVLSQIYPCSDDSRMLQACSQAFDVSVFEIFFAWANGMCLCAATNDTLFEDLEQSIRQLQVTHLSMTVTVASLVNPDKVPKVQFLVTSGEAMTDEVLQRWSEALFQGYGPSETTNICTVRKVAPGDSSQYLGWSFENTSSFVFSPDSDELVPMGCVGELVFGGDQVAAGYLNMPELTAAKFFSHPQYGRLYRSGDLGRMLPDGSLIILGRIDTQVKLRGQRIELQEIHAVALGSGLARACTSVVLSRETAQHSQQLALYYVPSGFEGRPFAVLSLTDDLKRTNFALFQALQAALPSYMIPSFLFPIASLPLTSSGKTDAARLRDLTRSLTDEVLNLYTSSDYEVEDETEWTDVEVEVAKALTEVLKVDKSMITRWTSFAALGLDSISAMPLTRKLQTQLKTKIPISQVLQNPSVSRLAQSISITTSTTAGGERQQLLPSSLLQIVTEQYSARDKIVEAILPCTPLQEAMLASSIRGGSYCNQMLFQLHKAPEQIVAYWDQMIQRHGILRTCFSTTEDPEHPLVQVVLSNDSMRPLPTRVSTYEKDFQKCVDQHLRSIPKVIDSSDPPLSLEIIQSDNGNFLSFACHHALYDGVAIGILLSEIEALARQEALAPPFSFEHFLREGLTLPPDTDEFWKRHFGNFRPRSLPRKGEGQDTDSSTLVTGACSISLASIEVRLRELGISMLSACQAAWAVSLAAMLNAPDVCFGNVVSGRSVSLEGIDSLVAPCFNTIPLRIDLEATASNRDLTKELQALNARMLQYQFTPLRKIQGVFGLSGSQLFDSLLLLQPPAQALDTNIWELKMERGGMDVPIICEVLPCTEADALNVVVHRDASSFSEALAKLMLDLFLHALDSCLRYPASQVVLAPKLPRSLQDSLQGFSLAVEESSGPTPSKDAMAPDDDTWTKSELSVRAVISKLSKTTSRIGRGTSIHRYGLDSISAVQIAHLLRQDGFAVSAVDVLENPTCAGIASRLQNDSSFTKPQLPDYDLEGFRGHVQKETNRDIRPDALLPCTPLQQGMISQFILSEGSSYFNYVSWSLDPGVDTRALFNAWELLVRRHKILRTGFINVHHPDTSFAMLTYGEKEMPINVSVLSGKQVEDFDVEQWRLDCARCTLNDISLPPWQVAIVDGREKKMHLAMHHALYDAYSLEVLLNELALIFRGPSLPAPAPTEDAVTAVFEQISRSKSDSEDYWKAKGADLVLNSFPVMTPLRIDVREVFHASLDSDLSPRIVKEKAARAGVTVQAALQAAWTRLLSSYHGDSAVVFGVVLSGRSSDVFKDAMFPCITTLPVIAQNLESNQELLQSMMECNAGLRRHEHTPLSQVQKWTGTPDTALFDTILVYQQSAQDIQDDWPWHMESEKATVDYPVSLEIQESAELLRFNLDFYSDILPMDQAHLILSQFDAIFNHILDAPDCAADDLALVSPDVFSVLAAEHEDLVSPVSLLHEFVVQSARRYPNQPALEFVHDLADEKARSRWTYQELDNIGNKFANFLVLQGVKPGGIVAVLFDKCPEAYISILGILKAGCAFVALDPGAPAARKEFILQDSEALALLVKTTHDLGFQSPVQVLEVNMDSLESYATEDLKLERPISPADTCYCLYTSGTTGTPKGCLITHDNAVQAMLAFQELFLGHWDQTSRWLQFASFHFDVSVLEQYWSWSVGITVVSAPKDLILSDLISTISTLDITHIDLTPSLARLVHPDEVPSLCKGVFITGGEQLRQDILDVWGDKSVIYNAYGPTEATIGVTMYCRVPQNGRSSNIGKQFPNVGSYVLRPGTDVPVLRGGVGELCVSGRLVGKGYLNRDQLTEERFSTLEGFQERVYRTGDLVRVLHDGCFDFLGRADDQVKLRGQRLEIGEINHVISGVDGVADVVTLVAKHGNQDRNVLVSFIVANATPNGSKGLAVLTDAASVKLCTAAQEACRARLPGYMVPTHFFGVPFVPLSANNKAQASTLKQLFGEIRPEQLMQLSSQTRDDAPLQESEPHLARVVAEVARVEAKDVRKESSIFDLGIDSITVIELARRLQSAGFSGASPSAILRNPRFGALARILRESAGPQSAGQVAQVQQLIRACHHSHLGAVCRTLGTTADNVEYIAPCTPLQEGMVTRSVSGERGVYFNTFRFQLASTVSVARLRGAWQKVIGAHSILRTCFLQTADGYIQVALRNVPSCWTDSEISSESELERQSADRYERWIQSNEDGVRQPLEVDCIRKGTSHTLVVRIFHGLYDARSFDLLLGQVKAAYDATAVEGAAKPVVVPAFIDVLPHGPLCDFSDTRSFWEETFEGFQFEPMPSLIEQGQPGGRDAVVSASCDLAALEARRMALGVTQQTMVQTAWVSVLRQRFAAWPTIGIILSGRSLMMDGIENTIGPLFNTLPFRVSQNSASTWADLIQEVHQFNASVLSFAHVPLRQIQKWCSHGQPLFDTLFTFDREDGGGNEGGGEDGGAHWTEVASTSPSDYPLAIEAIVARNNRLKVTVVAQSHIADDEALRGLLAQFENTLAMMAQDEQPPWLRGNLSSSEGTLSPTPTGTSVSSNTDHSVDSLFTWTDLARSVQGAIAAVAGVAAEQVRSDTTLFELGLDSIDAVRIVTRLRRLGLGLTTSELMKRPTVRSIVASVAATTANASSAEETASGHMRQLEAQASVLKAYLLKKGHDVSDAAGVEAVWPPTPLQDAMVAEMVLSDFRRYFNHDVLELGDGVDADRLVAALRTVVTGSPVLRTTFVEVEDANIHSAYCQVVWRPQVRELAEEALVERVTLDRLDDVDGLLEAARQRAVKAKGAAGLLQFAVATVAASGRRYLVLSIAHALYDGTSLGLFHRDVRDAYEGRYRPRGPYNATLAAILARSGGEAETFWAQFLQGARPTLLRPVAEGKSATTTPDQAATVYRDEATSRVPARALRGFCARHGVTPQVLGQASWAAALAARTGRLDVVFGVVLSGRDTDAAQEGGVLFPTMNTVPVRVVLHGDGAGFVRYVWENLGGVNAGQHFPLRRAQRVAGRRGPLFNTLFAMQSSGGRGEGKAGGGGGGGDGGADGFWKSVRSAAEVEYPVCVEMEIVGGGGGAGEEEMERLVWRVACDQAYVPRAEAEGLIGRLDRVLEYLVGGSDRESPASRQVVTFETDRRVSICGLPVVELEADGDEQVATDDGGGGSDEVAPEKTTPELDAVMDVLAHVSGVEKGTISPQQSIYNLGLDSISAIKVSALLRKRGAVQVSVRDLVGGGSIGQVVEKAMAAAPARSKPGTANNTTTSSNNNSAAEESMAAQAQRVLKECGIDDIDALVAKSGLDPGRELVEMVLPTLPVQTHMLSMWQNSCGELFFYEFTLVLEPTTTTTPLTAGGVARAWRALVAEAPILRTRFAATGLRTIPFVQVLARAASAEEGDLAVEHSATEKVEAGAWTFAHASSPFVLLRAEYAGTPGSAVHLTLKIHHALYDGVSLPLLLGRLKALCLPSADADTSPRPLAPLERQPWTEFVLAHYGDEAVRARRKAFWTAYLEGATSTGSAVSGVDRGATPDASDAVSASSSSAPSTRTACFRKAALKDVGRLREAAAECGVTVQALFFATYARVLSDARGGLPAAEEGEEDDERTIDVTFGIYLANRHDFTGRTPTGGDDDQEAAALDEAMWPTLGIVPLRVRFNHRAESVLDVARRVQRDVNAISAFENASVGLWEIAEWTGVRVGSFVNFLSLPGEEGEEESTDASAETVQSPVKTGAATTSVAATMELARPDGTWIEGSGVRDVYLDAMDIEAAVRDGRLDVGVFASSRLVSQDEAGGVVDAVCARLEGACR